MHSVCIPFGPLIYKADIRGKFHDFLLEGVDDYRTSLSAKEYLVGNIDEQRLSPYDPDKFVGFLNEHILNYLHEKHSRHNSIKNCCLIEEVPFNINEAKVTYNLGEGPWINYQKNGEFNPIHNHSGRLSAVVFVDIPDKIENERETSDYTAKACGCLEFIFGNQHILVRPKSGYMYLFPSDLWHAVYPFKSDVERITISFNVHELNINDVSAEINHYSNYPISS